LNFDDFLKFAVKNNASDVYLQAGSKPKLRIAGQFRSVESPPPSAEDLKAFLGRIVPPGEPGGVEAALAEGRRFSRGLPGLGRFRATLFQHLDAPGVCLRPIPETPRSLESLGLPSVLREIALARRGLTLVVGAAGNGLTTTIAAMIDAINQAQACSVVTLENPVEFLHTPKQALVTHLTDALDPKTIRHALDLAPDALALGVIDRTEPMLRAVLDAAATGHQVIAALRAPNAIRALEELIAAVPGDHRAMVKRGLADRLEATVAIRLVQTKQGAIRPVVEVFRMVSQTRQLYLDNRLDDLGRLMAARLSGMQNFDRQLLELYQAGTISGTEAMKQATDPEALAAELHARR